MMMIVVAAAGAHLHCFRQSLGGGALAELRLQCRRRRSNPSHADDHEQTHTHTQSLIVRPTGEFKRA